MSGRPVDGSVRLTVALTAFSVLAYEVSLTRIFSVLFRSPYVFLILSIAVCGLGLGSWLAALLGRDRERELDGPLLALAVLLPLPVVLLFTVASPLVAQANGVAVAGLTLAPYVAAGLLLARAFRAYAADAGRLYACDLGGAALAALGTAALVTRIGAIAVPLLLGGLVAAAGVAALRRRALAALLAVGWLALTVGQVRYDLLRLPPLTSHDPLKVKPLFQELADPAAGARIRATRWSAVARTDVVSNTGTDTLYIWTDGDVPTQMEPFNGDLRTAQSYTSFIGYVPFGLHPRPERVLCIGPGGGLDVLLALLGGARSIEPVELNPAIAPLTEQFKGFYGDLYHRPELPAGLIIDEGRSYLSRSPRRYDVLYFALAKSATTQQGGMALVDNYLYTVEAFGQYLDHLQPGGLLALVLQEPHLTDRCLVTAVEALRRRGVSGAEMQRRIAWLELPEALAAGPYRQLLLVRNGAFDAPLNQRLRELGIARALSPRLLPGARWPAPYDAITQPGLTGDAYARAVAQQDRYFGRLHPGGPWVRFRLDVVTDDRPFYADFSPGLHPFLTGLLRLTGGLGLVALLAAGWHVRRRRRVGLVAAAGTVSYFACLGAGFLMVEVALIQKLVLLLGYPTLSLSVILFALLLGSAAGGWLANRGDDAASGRRLTVVIALLVAALVVFGAAVTPLTQALLPTALAGRIAVTVVITAGLGLLMGQPFPTGLRVLGAQAADLVPTAWAVNGVLSVTGSVVAAALAARYGYQVVLAAGAGVYALAWLTAKAWFTDHVASPGAASETGSDAGTEGR